MTERRLTVDRSSRGTVEVASQQPPPQPAPPPAYKLVALSSHRIFSKEVIIVVSFLSVDRFATYLMHYYIRMTFIPYCLLEHETAIIEGHISLYFQIQVLSGLVPAMLADSYIRKDLVFKIIIAIGSFSGTILCYLATISSQYAYSQSFDLKEKLFITYIAFQSFNEIGRPLQQSLLLDQFANLRDFTLDTTKILSVLFMSKEVFKLMTFALAIFTSSDKTAAAKGQLIPPIVSIGATFLLIFLTWRKYPLMWHKPHYNSIFKILGCLLQKFSVFVMTAIFRCDYRQFIKYSERTRKETDVFWKMNKAMICAYPYYYCQRVTDLWSFTNITADYNSRGNAIQQLYGQCMKIAFLAISQFVAFPILYRTRMKNILSSPIKRMITCYGLVGLCGLVTFVIICLNQRKGLALFHDKSSNLVFLYNMLNVTVDLELFNKLGGDPLQIKPFQRHLIVLENTIPLQISLTCKQLQMDEYHQLEVNNNDAFFITVFGLELVKMVEPADRSDVRESDLLVVCLLLLCRGSVIFDCGGHPNAFELHNFGTKYKMSVKRGSKCKVNHYSTQGLLNTENSQLEIFVSQPVYYVAATESLENVISLKLLQFDEKPQDNLWLVLPVDLLSSWANMVFEIAFFQFVIIEGMPSFQTTLVAIVFSYQNIAQLSSKIFLKGGGLVSEKNAIIFSVIYLIGFVWFLTRMRHFHTADRIKELYEQEEVAEVQNFASFREMSNKPKTSMGSGGYR